ncbi:hypothetical protein AGMMS49546_20640 [Spirochaetia bacterium]|nr:hypothetical protein AGMMS49546_20640 [Spirochaetia bacterium]
MNFIQENLSTIIVAVIVFGTLIAVTVRLIKNVRRGKLSCGCEKCGKCAAVNIPRSTN